MRDETGLAWFRGASICPTASRHGAYWIAAYCRTLWAPQSLSARGYQMFLKTPRRTPDAPRNWSQVLITSCVNLSWPPFICTRPWGPAAVLKRRWLVYFLFHFLALSSLSPESQIFKDPTVPEPRIVCHWRRAAGLTSQNAENVAGSLSCLQLRNCKTILQSWMTLVSTLNKPDTLSSIS